MLTTLALALGPFALGVTPLAGQDEPNHTKVSLVAEKTAVEPGGTITFAAIFDIDKEWHIYWDGQNDTGQPPKFDQEKFPVGVTLGEIGWPVPHRHVLPGDIVDHIFEQRAVVLLPLKVAPDAKPGTTFSFDVPVEWMECANVCQFGSGTVKVDFRVVERAADAKPGAGAAIIAAARKAMPLAIEKESPIVFDVRGSKLTITAKGAESVSFMPHRSSTELSDLAGEGEAKGETLAASLKQDQAKSLERLPVVGIISVKKDKVMTSYWVDTTAKPEKKAEANPKPKSGDSPAGTSPGR